MKNLLLKWSLNILTRLLIRKYNPYIIAVTGSVGKTSTKEAIVSLLSNNFNVRGSSGNLNTEFGAPLVFLKEDKAAESFKEWIEIIGRGVLLLFSKNDYPEMIVVEVAADKPGDIRYLSKIIKPHIAVVTAIGEVPVHIEFYKDAEDVAKEKKILTSFSREINILSFDDPLVEKMSEKRITFGFNKGADVQIKDFKNTLEGSSFTLSYNGRESYFNIPFIGKPYAYSVAAAFSVATYLGIDNVSLGVMKNPPGRLSLIEGKKDTLIIDGSYNSSPIALSSALETLKSLPGKRKIAVIGDMLDLGEYSEEEHSKIREKASFCDHLISVGKYAKYVGGVTLSRSEDAIPLLEEIIKPGDVILIKGSQGVRTEKIVLGIMRYPERAKDLLVRQTPFWKKR